MKQAFEITDITNIDKLYGRSSLVRKLSILAKRC